MAVLPSLSISVLLRKRNAETPSHGGVDTGKAYKTIDVIMDHLQSCEDILGRVFGAHTTFNWDSLRVLHDGSEYIVVTIGENQLSLRLQHVPHPNDFSRDFYELSFDQLKLGDNPNWITLGILLLALFNALNRRIDHDSTKPTKDLFDAGFAEIECRLLNDSDPLVEAMAGSLVARGDADIGRAMQVVYNRQSCLMVLGFYNGRINGVEGVLMQEAEYTLSGVTGTTPNWYSNEFATEVARMMWKGDKSSNPQTPIFSYCPPVQS